MPTTTLCPHSAPYHLWLTLHDNSAGRDFNVHILRNWLYQRRRSHPDPALRVWAHYLNRHTSLSTMLRRMEKRGLLLSSGGSGRSLIWRLNPAATATVRASRFSHGEMLDLTQAIDAVLQLYPGQRIPPTDLREILRHWLRARGLDSSDDTVWLILTELEDERLLLRTEVVPEEPSGRYEYRWNNHIAAIARLSLSWQAGLPLAAPGAAASTGTPSPLPASLTIPPDLDAVTTGMLLLQVPAASEDSATLLARFDTVVATVAADHGVDAGRLRNLSARRLFVLADHAAAAAERPGPSQQTFSPFLATDFLATLDHELRNAIGHAAGVAAGMYQRQQAGSADLQFMQAALDRIAQQVGDHYGLDPDALMLQTLSQLSLPDIGGHDTERLLQSLEELLADSGPGAFAAVGQTAPQRVLVLEIEPETPVPAVERAAELRMAHAPLGTERYRLLRGGVWQRHDGQRWTVLDAPLPADPASTLKLVLVGEGQSHSSREDSDRVSGYFGDDLATCIGDLLAPSTRIERISLLACRPGLGFVQSLLETLDTQQIAVGDVVRRRGPVLLGDDGRAWVGLRPPLGWRHGPGTREIVRLAPDSGTLTIRPDDGGRVGELESLPAQHAGPLGTPPDEAWAEGEAWAGRARDTLDRIYRGAGLDDDWIALLATVRQEPDGQGSLRLLHPASGTTRDVATRDPRLAAAVAHIEQRLPALDGGAGIGFHAVNRLFGYALGLAPLLERGDGDGVGGATPLDRALRLHAVLGRTQLTHTALDDIGALTRQALQLARAGRALGPGARLVTTLGDGLGLASRALGPIFGLANIGFDLYEVGHAASAEERALFGTRLGFDVTAAAVESAALATAALGLGTVAEAAGPVGLAIALIGYAVTGALLDAQRRRALLAAEASVEVFFQHLGEGYRDTGCHLVNDTLQPHPACVITLLDLPAARVGFGAPGLMASRLIRASYLDPDAIDFPLLNIMAPQMIDDPARALPLRARLGQAAEAMLGTAAAAAPRIELPATPEYLIRYRYRRLRKPYARLPDAVTTHPGYAVIRRLEAHGDFFAERAGIGIVELEPDYRDTTIRVRLGPAPRQLLAPPVSDEVGGRLRYVLQGGGGRYALALSSRVAGCRLETEAGTRSEWLIDAGVLPQATLGDIDTEGFTLGGIRFEVAASADSVTVREAGGDIWRVECATGTRRLLALDAARLTTQADADLTARLRARLDLPGLSVADSIALANTGRDDSAFYLTAERRVQFAGAPDAELLCFRPGAAFFIDRTRSHLWRSTAAGAPDARLQLAIEGDDTRISAIAAENGTVLLEQQVGPAQNPTLILRYRLDPDASVLELYGVVTAQAVPQQLPPGDWPGWLLRAAAFTPRATAPGRCPQQIACRAAPWQALSERPDGGVTRWRRARDGLILHLRAHDERVPPLDLMPLADTGATVFLYSPSLRAVFRQVADAALERLPLPPTARVAVVGEAPLLVDDTGVMRRLAPDGSAELAGVARSWLDAHRGDWWRRLPELARRPGDEPASYEAPIALPAVLDAEGRTRDIWFDARRHRFVVTPPALAGVKTHWLGIDDDGLTWLLALPAGRLHVGTALEPDALAARLDSDGRLVCEVTLTTQTPLPDERIVDGEIVAGRLQARSAAGLRLQMTSGRPQLQAVDEDWLAAHPSPRGEALAALARRYPHGETFRLGHARTVGWYHIAAERTIAAAQARDPVYIGYNAARDAGYYYDRADGCMRYDDRRRGSPLDRDYLGACRHGSWLLLHGRGADAGMLAPLTLDGVSHVWLCGDGDEHYHLDETAWQGLRRLVIDDYAAGETGSVLTLDFPAAARLRVAERDGHLLLREENGARCIEFWLALAPDGAPRRRLGVRLGSAPPLALARLAATDFDRSGRIALADAR
jgi:hypothetical protein